MELITYTICGRLFIVDHGKCELREAASPSNTIPFHDLCPDGSNYLLAFDPQEGAPFAGEWEPLPPHVQFITIPRDIISFNTQLLF